MVALLAAVIKVCAFRLIYHCNNKRLIQVYRDCSKFFITPIPHRKKDPLQINLILSKLSRRFNQAKPWPPKKACLHKLLYPRMDMLWPCYSLQARYPACLSTPISICGSTVMKINIEKVSLPYKAPFSITGYTFTSAETVRVTLTDNSIIGRSEARGIGGAALGIYYEGETMDSMAAQLDAITDKVIAGISREALQELLPYGGARNALDCALWDLEAKKTGKSIWQLLNVTPKPITTVYTLGAGSASAMAEAATKAAQFSHLKIKLTADNPIEKLEAIRAARPDARLIVDVNQGWNFAELKEYIPAAEKLDITMIEQPLPRGSDEELEGFKSAIPLGADESCLDTVEYQTAVKRYDVINIKLDKCGGLTEALNIVKLAKRDGKGLMVGNMGGSSISMAPSFVVGQFCQYVDIDGPLLLKQDVDNGLHYGDGGMVSLPNPLLWG